MVAAVFEDLYPVSYRVTSTIQLDQIYFDFIGQLLVDDKSVELGNFCNLLVELLTNVSFDI